MGWLFLQLLPLVSNKHMISLSLSGWVNFGMGARAQTSCTQAFEDSLVMV